MLTNKKKLLLYLLDVLEKRGIESKTFMQKILFLLKKERNIDQIIKFYSFFPYNYGPFSNIVYKDLAGLKKEKLITEKNKLTNKGLKNKIYDLKIFNIVNDTINKFNSLPSLKKYIYEKYPEYTIKSKLIKHTTKKRKPGLFTIGYEGKDIDSFLDVLIQCQIDIVIDVRNNPFSMNFSFIKDKLKNYLEKLEIDYMHLPSLGVKSDLRKNLKDEKDYKKLFNYYKKNISKYQCELDIIKKLFSKKRVALLCFEENVKHCHRKILANYLYDKAIDI